ncbi:MAG TPA: lipopolysaccharide biosynthesis protein [Candidatus Paceibacterota bacterium]|nr:lipopolysaccharide biosynthesis protein [Candidatus Paceibacterota bacterium]
MLFLKTGYIKKLKELWFGSEKTSVGRQAVRSSLVVMMSRTLMKGFQFIRMVILARLLFPNDFGLFGMAAIALGLIDNFFQTGFYSAIIHKKEGADKYLDSAWSFNIIRNTFVALVLFLSAPLVGWFFDNNETVVMLVRILALPVFVIGFENPGIILWQKELCFNKKSQFDLCVVFLEIVITIVAAVILRNVWALAIGAVANRFIAVFLSYVFHRYRPRFIIDWRKIKELYFYGRWIGISSIVNFFVGQGDNLTIGKILGSAVLGFYQVAFSLGMMPAMEIARVFSGILFPLFAKIQHDKELLRRTYVRVASLIFALTIPASFGLFMLAREITVFVYGPRWLSMVPILMILVWVGFLKSFEQVTNSFFLGIGRPSISTSSSLIQLLAMLIFIVPLTFALGGEGAALAVVTGALFTQLYLLYILRQEINLGVWGISKTALEPAAASFFMVAGLYILKQVWPIFSWWSLLTYVGLGVIIYVLAVAVLDMLFTRELKNSLIWIKENH